MTNFGEISGLKQWATLLLGAILLTVSILRERLFARKHERYEKEVER